MTNDIINCNLIGKEVTTEHGRGVICEIEFTTGRYYVEIVDNYGVPIIRSLYPEGKLMYHKNDVSFTKMKHFSEV